MIQAHNSNIAKKVLLVAFGAWLSLPGPTSAESDKEIQEKALKAREMSHAGTAMDHSQHAGPEATASQFRGVFYGYLPCQDEGCSGLKMTLSLNPKNNYLLVTQPAMVLNRESFEKGKYLWDEAQGVVVLTPNRDAPPRQLAIKDSGVLLYLSQDGKPLPGDQDKYLLERSDKAGNREMHIH